MSRKGECLDNAVAESFFGTLKTEHTDHEDYQTRKAAKQSLFEHIEILYKWKHPETVVAQDVKKKPIWDELQQQIYLGGEKFVKRV